VRLNQKARRMPKKPSHKHHGLGSKPLKELPATERARIAIEAIGPGEVSDKLCRFAIPSIPPLPPPIAVLLAEQVEILALAYAKAQNDLKANTARGEFYQQYCRMVDELREFRAFLRDHFSEQLERAVAVDQPLLLMVKATMLDLKTCVSNPPKRARRQPSAKKTPNKAPKKR
jgi:hypothetical protein